MVIEPTVYMYMYMEKILFLDSFFWRRSLASSVSSAKRSRHNVTQYYPIHMRTLTKDVDQVYPLMKYRVGTTL